MVDIFLGFLFLYLLFTGIHRGFVEIFIKVIIWGLGVLVAFQFSPLLSPFLSQYFNASETLLNFLSFLFLFLPFLGLTWWLNSYIHKHLKKKRSLSFLNKLLGGVLATIAFIILIIFLNEQSKQYSVLKDILSSSKIVKTIASLENFIFQDQKH
ncbi:MAG: CvpA family protein [Aquificae bacterium]|nr:CvpA family protein [Aquificota bacterium]